MLPVVVIVLAVVVTIAAAAVAILATTMAGVADVVVLGTMCVSPNFNSCRFANKFA